ncbi:MAG: hypothetical protein M1445_12460 [Bacteroidetes bacterium]|nr:hypothetical protein [Bacteroidota bacterium]
MTKEKEVLYKGLGKKEIEQIPKFLEPKGTAAAGAGVDLGKLKTELGTTFEKIKPVLHEERQTMKQLVYDAVKQGRITGDQAKEYLKRGYFPHVDFTREPAGVFENLKTLITGKKPSLIEKGAGDLKIGEYRSYFKQRGGAAGFTMNAPKATLTRQLRQLRDNLVQDALKTVKDKFGFKLGGKATMPEGFVPFLDQTPGRLKELKGFALPKNVAEYLTQSFRSYNEVERAVDQFNRLWKPTATSLNLPYHLTNVIGNLYNSWLGGMHNPQRFLQAVKGGFTPAERKLIEESGIVAKNQFVGDIAGRSFDEVMRGKLPKVTGWINKAGQWLENNARSALFLDTRERLIASGVKTIDATKEASKYANAHLFDYINGFTPFENSVMRRIFPFYSWTRKNIPLQLSKFYTDTGKQMATIKAFKAMNPEGQPEGDQAGLTIPTGLTDKGGQKIRMKPPLPIQDVFEPPLQKVSQMVSPLIKDIPQAVLYGLAKLAKPQGKTPFVPVDFFTGKERTGKSFPFLKQFGNITTSMATSLLRPVRTYQNVMGESGPLKTGRFFLPGFYREPSKEQLDLRRISEGKALSEDAKQQIYDIMNDPYLSYEEKQNKINDLMKYVK